MAEGGTEGPQVSLKEESKEATSRICDINENISCSDSRESDSETENVPGPGAGRAGIANKDESQSALSRTNNVSQNTFKACADKLEGAIEHTRANDSISDAETGPNGKDRDTGAPFARDSSINIDDRIVDDGTLDETSLQIPEVSNLSTDNESQSTTSSSNAAYRGVLRECVDTLREAIENDRAGNYQEALDKYKIGCQNMIFCIKYEQGNDSRQRLRIKCSEYLSRAETIKGYLDRQREAAIRPGSVNVGHVPQLGHNMTNQEHSMIRDTYICHASCTFDDVHGLETQKLYLKEHIMIPKLFPQLFTGRRGMGMNILLHGLPGNGKTMLAKAIVPTIRQSRNQLGHPAVPINVFHACLNMLLHYRYENPETRIRTLFQMLQREENAILILDEISCIDGSCARESDRRALTELIVQWHGCSSNVTIIGIANEPWNMPSPFRRRFEKRLHVPMPDHDTRADILFGSLKNIEHTMTAHDIQDLALRTNGFTGSDLIVICRDAAMEPIREIMASGILQKIMNNDARQHKTKNTTQEETTDSENNTEYSRSSETVSQAEPNFNNTDNANFIQSTGTDRAVPSQHSDDAKLNQNADGQEASLNAEGTEASQNADCLESNQNTGGREAILNDKSPEDILSEEDIVIRPIVKDDIERILAKSKPCVDPQDVKKQEEWAENYGSNHEDYGPLQRKVTSLQEWSAKVIASKLRNGEERENVNQLDIPAPFKFRILKHLNLPWYIFKD